MPVEVIGYIVSGVVGIIAAVLGFIASNKKTRVEQAKQLADYNAALEANLNSFKEDTRDEVSKLQDAVADHKVSTQASIRELQDSQKHFQDLMAYKLDALEKKQDKHNSVIERVFALEQAVKDMKEVHS